MQTVAIHVTNLSIDAFNPRRSVDSEAISQLAGNLLAIGVVAPLVVRPAPPNSTEQKYTVLCGSRRLAAARQAGLSTVPCIVRELTDAEAAAIALTEQNSHESLHFLERADALMKWRDAGATIDTIAEAMGWKKAYAYSVINVAERLTPQARKACFENRLNETNARGLATVPRSAQDACLMKGLEPGFDGKPKSTREWEEVIASYRRDLTKAPFDMADPVLKCSEFDGPCTECPLRSGTQPELFPDVSNPNLCTSPAGYESRADEMWKRLVDEGKRKVGPECLEPAQTDRYFQATGTLRDDVPYVELGAICYADTAQRPYSALVSAEYKREHTKLMRVPKKLDVVEVLGKEGLEEEMSLAMKIRRPKVALPVGTTKKDDEKTLSADERKKHKEKVERRQAAIRRLIGMISIKAAKRDFDKKLLLMLCSSLCDQGAARLAMKRRDVKEPEKYLAKLDEGSLRAFLIEASLEYELFGDEGDHLYTPRIKELAAYYGIDPKDAEKEVVAEEKAAPKKTKKEAA